MNTLTKLLLAFVIFLSGCGKSPQKVNDEKIEEYQTYYDIVNKTQKFKDSSENFNIALEMSQIPDGTYRYAIVVDEAKIAINKILAGAKNIELNPQNQQIRKLQHELVDQYSLKSTSIGEGENRHLRIHK